MPPDTKPDDQSKLPTKPLTPVGADVPPDEERLTDSRIGGAHPNDQGKVPTTPLTAAGADVPPDEERLTDSLVGAALGAGLSKPVPGWEPPTPEELQRAFPQYEICGILGRGGMGAVYKGWQKALARFVAIKILPPVFDDGMSDFTERFKREGKAMAQLRHPGIVAVHDAGETPDGLLYFIMECIEGTDVQKLVTERGRLAPGEALRITQAVCGALAYAHGHGVIHRDIKPSNIMIDANGEVKIADFGLAKSTAPGTTALTMSNQAMGTLAFMAPEAMQGVAHVDHRADIFAVGVMLYQMLTGKLPHGKYDAPSRLVPGLGRRLNRIVDRALKPERTERYASASEMAAALAPITLSIAKRTADHDRRAGSRKTAALIALAVLALAGVLLAKFGPWKRATPDTATKDAPFVNTLGQEFVPVPGTGVLFCRWETRVKDYEVFANATKADDLWKKQDKDGVPVSVSVAPDYPVVGVAMAIFTIVRSVNTGPDYPVVGVNWHDAKAFCQWLTEKERAEGKLPKGMEYRLPTDEEWSRAVGLAKEEGTTPKEKSGKNGLDYPWGRELPLPNGKAGNYADSEFKKTFPKEQDKWIVGYTDGFATTSPVGSFGRNGFGICDLGGNVWEWCKDWYDSEQKDRVVRGASWQNHDDGLLLSSYRHRLAPGHRGRIYGFRCVITPAAR